MGPEQEGLETLSQLPGDLGHSFPKMERERGYFVTKCLNKMKMTYLLLGFSGRLYADKKCDV